MLGDTLTKAELATGLSVTTRTLDLWHLDGTGPTRVDLGDRTTRYPVDAVVAWIADSASGDVTLTLTPNRAFYVSPGNWKEDGRATQIVEFDPTIEEVHVCPSCGDFYAESKLLDHQATGCGDCWAARMDKG